MDRLGRGGGREALVEAETRGVWTVVRVYGSVGLPVCGCRPVLPLGNATAPGGT